MPEGTCPHCQKPIPEQKAPSPYKFTKDDYVAVTDQFLTKPIVLAGFAVIVVLGLFASGFYLNGVANRKLGELDVEVQRQLTSGGVEMRNRIEAQFARPEISNVVAEVAERRATRLLETQIYPVIQQFGSNVAESFTHFQKAGESNITELSATTSLAVQILAAQSDDAIAFDKLVELGVTNALAQVAFNQVLAQLELERMTIAAAGINFNESPWKGTDLTAEKASLEDYNVRLTAAMNLFEKLTLLNQLWNQGRFSVDDRLKFLARAIESAVSLRCRAHACLLMNQEAKINRTVLLWREYIDWFHAQQKQTPKP